MFELIGQWYVIATIGGAVLFVVFGLWSRAIDKRNERDR